MKTDGIKGFGLMTLAVVAGVFAVAGIRWAYAKARAKMDAASNPPA